MADGGHGFTIHTSQQASHSRWAQESVSSITGMEVNFNEVSSANTLDHKTVKSKRIESEDNLPLKKVRIENDLNHFDDEINLDISSMKNVLINPVIVR